MAISGEILAGLLGFSLVEKAGDTLDKIFESAFGESAKDLLRDGAARFSAKTGKIPSNHDLERAIRACELLATRTLLTRYAQEKERERRARGGLWSEPFVAAAQNWLGEQIGLPPGASPKPDHALVAELEAALDEALSARTLPELQTALAEPQRRVWEALADGAAGRDAWRAPDDFKEMFDGDGGEARPGWALVFVALMRESLKTNHTAEVAFLATRLAALRPLQQRMAAKIDRIDANVTNMREDMAALRGGMAQLMTMFEATTKAEEARQAGIEHSTIIAIAQPLKPGIALEVDQALVELQNAVDIALDVIVKGERQSNEEQFVTDVLTRRVALTRKGSFDESAREVDAALAELGRRRAERKRRRLEEDEAERRQRRALLEAGVEQDSLRRDAAAVARRIEAIAEAEHPGERAPWTKTFRTFWNRYYEEGTHKGVNLSLEIAIAMARRMADQARRADEKCAACNLLGTALGERGQREIGMGHLEEAVEAFRQALKECSRKEAPLIWAGTQNNLGVALRALGDREVGTACLNKSVAAYHEALKERTRERVPPDWAATQNNLGNALLALGERENGTSRLEEAVAAYHEALKERTCEHVPLDWAGTKNNLGNALRALGQRAHGTRRLEEAVTAFREALKVRTRERVPLDWAGTKNNLGVALCALGEQQNGTARLEEAIAAHREALEEKTRERTPLDWAMTQNNLGNALRAQGERESGTRRLGEAVAAIYEARQSWTRERAPLAWAGMQNNLGNALRALGERESGTGRLEEAVTAYREALTAFTPEASPYYFDMTQRNLSRALALLEERR